MSRIFLVLGLVCVAYALPSNKRRFNSMAMDTIMRHFSHLSERELKNPGKPVTLPATIDDVEAVTLPADIVRPVTLPGRLDNNQPVTLPETIGDGRKKDVIEDFKKKAKDECMNHEDFGTEFDENDCNEFAERSTKNFVMCLKSGGADPLICAMSSIACAVLEDLKPVSCAYVARKTAKIFAGCVISIDESELFQCGEKATECVMRVGQQDECDGFDKACGGRCVAGLKVCRRLKMPLIACLGKMRGCVQNPDAQGCGDGPEPTTDATPTDEKRQLLRNILRKLMDEE